MKTQNAVHKKHNSSLQSFTIFKRSNVMKALPLFFKRGAAIFATLVLVSALVFGQGNYSQTGTITNTGGTLVIKGTAGFGTQTSITGTVDYAKAGGSQNVTDVDYNNLTLSGGAGSGKVFPNSEVGVGGNLTLSGGVVSADVNARAGSSAKITYNGAGAQNVAAIDYQDIELATSGTKTFATGTTKIAGSFSLSGTAAADATTNPTTLEFDGSGAQSIAGINFDNLSITGTRSGTPAITLASGTIGIKSAFTVSPTGAVTYVTTGNTVDFNGTLAQTITAFNYNNLAISAARGVNDVTLASSGTIGIAGTFNPTATFGGGGYVVTGSTLDYNGTTGQSVVGGATFALYNNLTVSGSGTKNASGDISLTAAGVLNNSVTFNLGLNALTFTAAPTNTGTVQFAGGANGKPVGSTSGLVEYTGTIAQTVGIGTYFNLAFSNGTATTAEKSISGAVSVNNNLTVNGSSFLTVSAAVDITNNLLNNGTLTNSNTVQVDNDLTNGGSITNSGTITVGL